MEAPEPISGRGGGPVSWLGLGSCLFGALAAILLAVSFGGLVKVGVAARLPLDQRASLLRGMTSLVSLTGLGLGMGALLLGLLLGVVAIAQDQGKPILAILGTILNGSQLMTLTLFMGLGIFTLRQAAAARRAQVLASPPSPPGSSAPATPARPSFAEDIARRMASARATGFEPVLVADLASDPATYVSKKVAVSGFFSGQGPELFALYGRWGGGGIVWVDGATLAPQQKRALLLSLDNFHKVFVRGTFRRATAGKTAGGGAMIGARGAAPRLVADEIDDLGRVANPALEPPQSEP